MKHFSRESLHNFVESRVSEVSRGTVHRDIVCLRSMFSYAVETGMITADPVAKFRLLAVDEVTRPVLTVDQFRHLGDSMDRLPIGAMVAVMGCITRRMERCAMFHCQTIP